MSICITYPLPPKDGRGFVDQVSMPLYKLNACIYSFRKFG